MVLTIPTPRDSEAKLQYILRISARVFAQQGFAGASIRDISRASNVSLAGLYYYFQSKQHLLYLIQNNTFIVVVERLKLRLHEAQDPFDRLRILVLNHIEYFLSHPNEMRVLSHEEEALDQPYRDQVQAIKRKYYAIARDIFESLGHPAMPPGITSRIAVLSLFGMMNWPYKWYKPGVDPGAEDLTDAILGIFLHGVSPERYVNNKASIPETLTVEHD